MQQYEEHIGPEATQATTPEELHPVAAAFGGDIGAALEKTGNQIQNRIDMLANHMAQMNFWRGRETVADRLTQFSADKDQVIHGDPNNPNATVEVQRKPYEMVTGGDISAYPQGQGPSNTGPDQAGTPQTYNIPAGILNQTGRYAAGATERYASWYHGDGTAENPGYKQQVIQEMKSQGLGQRNIEYLVSRMDRDFASSGRFIAGHEAEQTRAAQQQSFIAGMIADSHSSVTAQDAPSMALKLNSITQHANDLAGSQGVKLNSEEGAKYLDLQQRYQTAALQTSTTAMIRSNNGDPTQSYAMLDKLHDNGNIDDTVYAQAKQSVDKGVKIVQDQNDRAQKVQLNNGRMNLISQVAQGKLDLTNQNSLLDIAQSDPKLYEAVNNNILNKNSNIKDNDEAYADGVQKVFSAGSKEQISNFVMHALKQNTNGEISQERFNILVGAAMDRGKHIADLEKDPVKGNPFQNMYDSAMKSLFGWNKQQGKQDGQTYVDFINGVKNNNGVPQAYENAIKNAIIRTHPETASLYTPPTYVINKKSHIQYVFPRTNRKEQNGNSDSGTTAE